MAAPPPDSNQSDPSDRAARRLAQLKRMRLLATGLLVLMLLIFLVTSAYVEAWPALGYVRAFAEAAMVGAIADWFAVVALFRRPFGLPIPHTAIIARNKDRIGESLGAFISNNFLAPEVVAAKMDSLNLSGKAAQWLAKPDNAALAAKRIAALLPPVLDGLDERHVRQFLHGTIHRALDSVAAAPLAARAMSVLVAHGHHQILFDRTIMAAESFLIANEDMIRDRVSDRSWKWLPRWVDEKVADKMMMGLMETLAELSHPHHPWRDEFQRTVEEFVDRLAHDPDYHERGEAIKRELLANPALAGYVDSLWSEIKTRLRDDLERDDGLLRQGIERALLAFGRRLDADLRMQAIGNRWARRAAERYVIPHRGQIAAFITGVVHRWDTATLVTKLELQVGKDLQYIRINGTLVGGLVGVVIYAATRALG